MANIPPLTSEQEIDLQFFSDGMQQILTQIWKRSLKEFEMYPIMTFEEAHAKLDALAVKHAPMQRFLDSPNDECGREVCMRDEPGVYYLLDIDNDGSAMKTGFRRIQLLFLNVHPHAEHYAAQIGWDIERIEVLPVVGQEHPGVHSAILCRPA